MKISKLPQTIMSTISMSAGLILGLYYTVTSLLSASRPNSMILPMIGIAIFLSAKTLIKISNKAKGNV